MIPDEYEFEVAAARKGIQQIADAEPDTTISLTVARITEDGGIEQESEVVLPAPAAAALLATVKPDQSIPGAGDNLYLLRVTRLAEKQSTPGAEPT